VYVCVREKGNEKDKEKERIYIYMYIYIYTCIYARNAHVQNTLLIINRKMVKRSEQAFYINDI
jgi:hypothetical protein